MYNFSYQSANSVADASAKVKEAEDGILIAGGMTIIPTLKQRLAQPTHVVDLSGVSGLSEITIGSENLITIGSMTTHATVAASTDVKNRIPTLSELADGIGDPQVRNRGTIGGSIANNDPAADYPSACVALNATIVTDQRQISADNFFNGMFETALTEGEVITAVSFPTPELAAYMKFPNPASRYAIVGVFIAKFDSGIRVAVTGAGQDGVFRISEMEDALEANFSADAVANISVSPDNLNSDIHASSEYRAHLITVMAKRAVAKIS